MKRIFPFLLIAMVAMSSTCTKSSDGIDVDELAGTWTLTEQYADPGNGQGTWQSYSGEPRFFIFQEDGKFTSTTPLQWTAFNRYKLIDKNTIQFYNEGQQDSSKHHFTFDGKRITLWLQCIEECKIRLARPIK